MSRCRRQIAATVSVLVGDFGRCYELVTVGGMLIVKDDNITSAGTVKWYIRQRVLGRVIDNDAVRAVLA
jgi:HK97 family phage major capsid protein